MTTPQHTISTYLTTEQRKQALKKAATTRKHRAQFKQRIHDGHYTPTQALQHARTTESLKNMRVRDLILAIPHMGPIRTHELMTKAGVSERKHVQGLQDRQRAQLIELLKTL